MFEKSISKETVYKGPIFDIDVHQIELPDGRISSRDVVVHGPAVAIVVRHESGYFLFIRQFRKSQEKVCIEVTAGCCDPGEENFHFCGSTPLSGKPYCKDHCDIAYIDEKELRKEKEAQKHKRIAA